MPDDHSKLVPLLPISNRTVKRLSADDSADSRVKVGHRQASNVRDARCEPGVFFSKECDSSIGIAVFSESLQSLLILGSLKIHSR